VEYAIACFIVVVVVVQSHQCRHYQQTAEAVSTWLHFMHTYWQCKRIFDLFLRQCVELFLDFDHRHFFMFRQCAVLHDNAKVIEAHQ
jgi:hypothetical protein